MVEILHYKKNKKYIFFTVIVGSFNFSSLKGPEPTFVEAETLIPYSTPYISVTASASD